MRISSVGLVYRNADGKVLRDAVMDAIMSSHCHLQSIDGSMAIALCVQYALRCDADHEVDHTELIKLIMDNMHSEEMKTAIQTVSKGLEGYHGFLKMQKEDDADLQDTEGVLEYDLQFLKEAKWLTFQIKAIEAVPFVLYSFLRWHRNPEQCAINVVNLGGDNDTTGAMVGALLGAMHGTGWIPRRWYENVENTWRETEDAQGKGGGDDEQKEDGNKLEMCTDAYGLDLVLFLAMELAKLDFKEHSKFVEKKSANMMDSVISKLKGVLPK